MEKIDKKLQLLKRKIEEIERKIFHNFFPSDEKLLYQEFLKYQVELGKLRNKNILREEQFNVILPCSKKTSSQDFDPTLMQILFRNFCGFKRPKTGWIQNPKCNNNSTIANLIRLKIGRDKISHLGIGAVNKKKYKEIYRYLKKPLKDLGCTSDDLHKLTPSSTRFKYTPAIGNFSFREEELVEIDKAIEESLKQASILAVSIFALSGIGKTQLVKRYFDLHSTNFNHAIVWVNAAEMEESFLELAKTINISTKDENDDDKKINMIIHEVHDYFQDETILFVFDNFEVPSNEDDLDEKLIKFIPQGNNVSCMITSQTEIMDDHHQFLKVRLKAWKISDAVSFIQNESSIECKDEVMEIVNIVGCNTFAINQFIAYIQRTRTPIKDYLQLLKKDPQNLNPQEKLYHSINITINRLENIDPYAFGLLHLMTFLNGKEIQRGLFICNDGYQENEYKSVTKTKKINDALYTLKKFCLIEEITDEKDFREDILSTHSLVQQTLRIYPRQNQTVEEVFTKVMLFLLDGKDDKFEDEMVLSDFIFFRYCYKQLIHIFNSFPEFKKQYLTICGKQFNKVMNIFHMQGRFKFLIMLLDEIKNEITLSDNLQELYQLETCIGYSFYYKRDFPKAFQVFSAVNSKQKQLLGERHPDTLRSSVGYTRCLNFLGFYRDGLDESERLHKDCIEVLGALHPQTLLCKRVLGLNKYNMGSEAASRTIYMEVLKGQIQNHGHQHPEVIVTRHDCIIHQKEWETKTTLLNDLLQDEIMIYGNMHLIVALTCYNLAFCYFTQEMYDEALKYVKLALVIRHSQCDEDHDDVICTAKLFTDILRKNRQRQSSRRRRPKRSKCTIS